MEQETAVVKIQPQNDEVVVALYNEGIKLQEYAKSRTVASIEDVRFATDDLSLIAKLKKAIEEKRKEYTSPINEHLKAVNDAFKGLTEPLLSADSITRHKILDYRQEQERNRLEEERINRLRMEAAEAEMKLKGELTQPVELLDMAVTQPKAYHTDAGTLGGMKVRKWEVQDFSQVLDEYKEINGSKVTKLVKAGIGAIAGIRIWEEETLRVNPWKQESDANL